MTAPMWPKILVAASLAAILGGLAYPWLKAPKRLSAPALPSHAPNLANGRTTFDAGGCASCHATPTQRDRTRLGGGLAITSPFGTFYVPNISPDPADGIGRWSEADFVTALGKGTSPEGAHYYPAFPYTTYQHARPTDLRDLFAYLKTLPAVAGRAPDHDLSFPFNIRRAVGVWKYLYLDGKPFVADAAQSPQWNRGAYLVNALAHCAECHSPRNFLGAVVEAQRFAGGPNPDGEGWVPNITQQGLKQWDETDIADFLKTGQTPDGDSAGGSMARVIRNTAMLSDADRAAMAAYLKSLTAVQGPTPPPRDKR